MMDWFVQIPPVCGTVPARTALMSFFDVMPGRAIILGRRSILRFSGSTPIFPNK